MGISKTTLQLHALPISPTCVRWSLPRRTWGSGWFFPWILVAAGLLVAALFGINDPTSLPSVSKNLANGNSDWLSFIVDLVFLLSDVLFSVVGLGLALAGLFLKFGTTRVEIDHTEIRSQDRFGPLHWTRRRPVNSIGRLEINVGTCSNNNGPQKPMPNVTALFAHTYGTEESNTIANHKKTPFVIAWAYPKEWLHELADALSKRIGSTQADGDALAITETFGDQPNGIDEHDEIPVAQPLKSRTILDQRDDGITLTIPPTGLLRGSKGMFFFAIMWNGINALITGTVIYAMIFPNGPVKSSGNGSPLIMLAITSIFWAIGIGIMLASIHMGRKHAILDVIGQGESAVILLTARSPICKPRQREWPVSDLTHICVGNSNMSVNDVPVRELQLHPIEGKHASMLIQLDDDELAWIASVLRLQTGLPANPRY